MNVLVSVIYVGSVYNSLYRPLVRNRGDYIMLELFKKNIFFITIIYVRTYFFLRCLSFNLE